MSNKINNFSGFVEDRDILFLIKFGKRKHLQEIVDGKVRFTPSQKYVEQEQQLHDKGQGDLLEGKMKIHCEFLQMESYETGKIVTVNHPTDILVSIQDVNNMPIVCFTCGTQENCSKYISNTNYVIDFADEMKDTINNDFHNPDSALIIFEPQKYIEDMKKQLNTVASSIRYYDYSKMWIQQYMFLCTGDENAPVGNGTMTYENRYRHLLCKDISFKNQKEYRFVKLDELINKPTKYDFSFNYDYEIVSCNDLFSGFVVKK